MDWSEFLALNLLGRDVSFIMRLPGIKQWRGPALGARQQADHLLIDMEWMGQLSIGGVWLLSQPDKPLVISMENTQPMERGTGEIILGTPTLHIMKIHTPGDTLTTHDMWPGLAQA